MKRHWWQKEVVYQIYPKSFYDSNNDGIGDIQGIIEKLDYLKNLGITMIWICPIYKSPMDDNGYDISNYYELSPEFGAIKDMDILIEEAKKRNLKIILDLVINHTSDEHEWFREAIKNDSSKYHDFYIFKKGKKRINNWRSVFGGSVWEKVPDKDEYYFHSFGKKQPDLNWENPILRENIYKMINWWLEKGISGFRVDAITFIKKDLSWQDKLVDGVDNLSNCTKSTRNQQGIGVFLEELKERTFSKFDCVTVAEAAGVNYEELEDFIGENGFFSMIFDFRYADLDIASGSEWFKRINWTVKTLKEKIKESQLALQKAGWAANFIENHDQPRATTKYLKNAQTNTDAIKMIAMMYFFLRGTPFIYQGQELGMKNFERKSINDFNDLSSIDQYYRSIKEGFSQEEALNFINLRSRDNARTPFPWKHEKYGGFSKVKPWLGMNEDYKDINVQSQLKNKDSILNFYKTMIDFRQNSQYRECLIYGDIEFYDSNKDVIAYKRINGTEQIDCFYNFSNNLVIEKLTKELKSEKIFSNKQNILLDNNILTLRPFEAVLIKRF